MDDVYWILDGKKARCVSQPEYSDWAMVNQVVRVAITHIDTNEYVSTVFLGINKNAWTGRPPAIFETMVFGGSHDDERHWTSTWNEAETMHRAVVDTIMAESAS